MMHAEQHAVPQRGALAPEQKPHEDTRLAAHARVEPTKAETCDRIMAFAVAREARGLTADEVAAEWQCSPNHCAPRISELKDEGRLVPTRHTRPTRSGSPARVLVAKQFSEPNTNKKEEPVEPGRLEQARTWIAAGRADPELATGSLFGDLTPDRSYLE